MIQLLANPIALLGLLSLPALVTIYWLQQRYRKRKVVSSLALWGFAAKSKDGGVRLQRIHTPLLFFLELLILLCLVIAAAGPRWPLWQQRAPLFVVLDDSYSMRANAPTSPQARAKKKLFSLTRGEQYPYIRLIKAGPTPTLLGGFLRTRRDLIQALKRWDCQASQSALSQATILARQLGGQHARVLVLTDKAPQHKTRMRRVQWMAFGTPQANLAITEATRSTHVDQDRVLLTVSNLSKTKQSTTLTLSDKGSKRTLKRFTLRLQAGKSQRLSITLPSGIKELTAQLQDDALTFDNRVILLPDKTPPLRVKLSITQPTLQGLFKRGLRSTQQVQFVSKGEELLITDQQGSTAEQKRPDLWRLQLYHRAPSKPYIGPYVTNRSHPLTQGLALKGVLWSAPAEPKLQGLPILMVGEQPLLTTQPDGEAGRLLELTIDAQRSTLQKTPNWPILLWNIIKERIHKRPGVRNKHVHLHSKVTIQVPETIRQVSLTSPSGKRSTHMAAENKMYIQADEPGVYRVQLANVIDTFVVNPLSYTESKLTEQITKRWGDWARDAEAKREHHDVTWLFLLLALVGIALHTFFSRRQPKTEGAHS
ncbi:MAG: hypothetical protein CL920_20415 [Deltaproteobacteria bacterium]|nr:hypothetical protein [Deltaproteobacteria bacterium]MBU51057.1 hypothetical protein [Deltaproteobacteria bacterium]|tara:strand:- start:5016 stop:6797 length:1782 start_codon:yes stop_codon:yes gene_type:complete